MIRSIDQDVKTDRYCLEKESERLPAIVKYWNDQWAQAQLDENSAENTLEVLTVNMEKKKGLAKAALDREAAILRKAIREKPEDYAKGEALKKLTDTLVESIVITQESYTKLQKEFEDVKAYVSSEEYQKLKKEYIQKRKASRILKGAVKAIEQKGFSINVLKDLWINGYYAASNVIPGTKDANLMHDEQKKHLTETIKRRSTR